MITIPAKTGTQILKKINPTLSHRVILLPSSTIDQSVKQKVLVPVTVMPLQATDVRQRSISLDGVPAPKIIVPLDGKPMQKMIVQNINAPSLQPASINTGLKKPILVKIMNGQMTTNSGVQHHIQRNVKKHSAIIKTQKSIPTNVVNNIGNGLPVCGREAVMKTIPLSRNQVKFVKSVSLKSPSVNGTSFLCENKSQSEVPIKVSPATQNMLNNGTKNKTVVISNKNSVLPIALQKHRALPISKTLQQFQLQENQRMMRINKTGMIYIHNTQKDQLQNFEIISHNSKVSQSGMKVYPKLAPRFDTNVKTGESPTTQRAVSIVGSVSIPHQSSGLSSMKSTSLSKSKSSDNFYAHFKMPVSLSTTTSCAKLSISSPAKTPTKRKLIKEPSKSMPTVVAEYFLSHMPAAQRELWGRLKKPVKRKRRHQRTSSLIPIPYETNYLCINNTIEKFGWKAYWYRKCRCSKIREKDAEGYQEDEENQAKPDELAKWVPTKLGERSRKALLGDFVQDQYVTENSERTLLKAKSEEDENVPGMPLESYSTSNCTKPCVDIPSCSTSESKYISSNIDGTSHTKLNLISKLDACDEQKPALPMAVGGKRKSSETTNLDHTKPFTMCLKAKYRKDKDGNWSAMPSTSFEDQANTENSVMLNIKSGPNVPAPASVMMEDRMGMTHDHGIRRCARATMMRRKALVKRALDAEMKHKAKREKLESFASKSFFFSANEDASMSNSSLNLVSSHPLCYRDDPAIMSRICSMQELKCKYAQSLLIKAPDNEGIDLHYRRKKMADSSIHDYLSSSVCEAVSNKLNKVKKGKKSCVFSDNAPEIRDYKGVLINKLENMWNHSATSIAKDKSSIVAEKVKGTPKPNTSVKMKSSKCRKVIMQITPDVAILNLQILRGMSFKDPPSNIISEESAKFVTSAMKNPKSKKETGVQRSAVPSKFEDGGLLADISREKCDIIDVSPSVIGDHVSVDKNPLSDIDGVEDKEEQDSKMADISEQVIGEVVTENSTDQINVDIGSSNVCQISQIETIPMVTEDHKKPHILKEGLSGNLNYPNNVIPKALIADLNNHEESSTVFEEKKQGQIVKDLMSELLNVVASEIKYERAAESKSNLVSHLPIAVKREEVFFEHKPEFKVNDNFCNTMSFDKLDKKTSFNSQLCNKNDTETNDIKGVEDSLELTDSPVLANRIIIAGEEMTKESSVDSPMNNAAIEMKEESLNSLLFTHTQLTSNSPPLEPKDCCPGTSESTTESKIFPEKPLPSFNEIYFTLKKSLKTPLGKIPDGVSCEQFLSSFKNVDFTQLHRRFRSINRLDKYLSPKINLAKLEKMFPVDEKQGSKNSKKSRKGSLLSKERLKFKRFLRRREFHSKEKIETNVGQDTVTLPTKFGNHFEISESSSSKMHSPMRVMHKSQLDLTAGSPVEATPETVRGNIFTKVSSLLNDSPAALESDVLDSGDLAVCSPSPCKFETGSTSEVSLVEEQISEAIIGADDLQIANSPSDCSEQTLETDSKIEETNSSLSSQQKRKKSSYIALDGMYWSNLVDPVESKIKKTGINLRRRRINSEEWLIGKKKEILNKRKRFSSHHVYPLSTQDALNAIIEIDDVSLKKFAHGVFDEDTDEDEEFLSAEPIRTLFSKSLNVERVRSWMWDSTLPKPLSLIFPQHAGHYQMPTPLYDIEHSQFDSVFSSQSLKRHRKSKLDKKEKINNSERQYHSDSEQMDRDQSESTNLEAKYSPIVSQAYVPLVRCSMPELTSSIVEDTFSTSNKTTQSVICDHSSTTSELFVVKRNSPDVSRPKGISGVHRRSSLKNSKRYSIFKLEDREENVSASKNDCEALLWEPQVSLRKITNPKFADIGQSSTLSLPKISMSQDTASETSVQLDVVGKDEGSNLLKELLDNGDYRKFFFKNCNTERKGGCTKLGNGTVSKLKQVRSCRLKRTDRSNEKKVSTSNLKKVPKLKEVHQIVGKRPRGRPQIKSIIANRCDDVSSNNNLNAMQSRRLFKRRSQLLLLSKSKNRAKVNLQALRRKVFVEMKKAEQLRSQRNIETVNSTQRRRPLLQSLYSTKGSYISRLLECDPDVVLGKD